MNHDWRRECRCSGMSDELREQFSGLDGSGFGTWCGNLANGEDTQCSHCREHCRVYVITLDEARLRAVLEGRLESV